MTLQTLPGWALAAGLVGLVALLALLQRLRVRHREVEVVTTLFWREATEAARARVLVRRFRHPLAFVLLLAAASLLWVAVAGPVVRREPEEDLVLVLDASAGVDAARFAAARDALLAEAARAPSSHRTVLAAGARPRTLLVPGEDALLLERRLEGLAPEPAPSSIEDRLDEIAAAAAPGRPLRVRVFGDRPLDGRRLAGWPEGVVVERATTPAPPPAGPALTALGLAEAASGAFAAVDVLVAVRAPAPPDVRVEVDGRAWPSPAPTRGPAGTFDVLLRDVPADGGTLVVRFGEGPAPAGRLRLPRRRLIRVLLPDDAPEPLRRALEADPAIAFVEEDPDVVVARGEGPADRPALVLVDDAEAEAALLVESPEDVEPEVLLERALEDLALEEVDATSLAEQAARPIVVSARAGPVRAVRLWASLVGDGYDLVASRTFPLLVARTVRWLAGLRAPEPWVAAGEPLRGWRGALRAEDGPPLDPAGDEAVPPSAGAWRLEDGTAVEAAVMEAAAPADARPTATDAGSPGSRFPVRTVLGLLAFALLVLQGALHRRGRIP